MGLTPVVTGILIKKRGTPHEERATQGRENAMWPWRQKLSSWHFKPRSAWCYWKNKEVFYYHLYSEVNKRWCYEEGRAKTEEGTSMHWAALQTSHLILTPCMVSAPILTFQMEELESKITDTQLRVPQWASGWKNSKQRPNFTACDLST